jgi:hypothetical protein
MRALAKLFLRASAWQLFILLFVVGLPPAVILTRLSLSALKIPFAYSAGMEVVLICLVVGLWSMEDFLNSQVLSSLRPKRGLFNFSLSFPLIYLPVFDALFPRLTTHPWLVRRGLGRKLPRNVLRILQLLLCFEMPGTGREEEIGVV